MWLPPPPVLATSTRGSAPSSISARRIASTPPFRGSISTASHPDAVPVAMPRLASGHLLNQPSITLGSVVAPFTPFFSLGCLPGRAQSGLPQEHLPSLTP